MTENPLRKEGVEARKLGDEYLLYDPDTGALHVLNASAQIIWQMCDGSHTSGEMQSAMRDAFDVCDADIAGDVEQILSSLREKGLLAGPPEGGPS